MKATMSVDGYPRFSIRIAHRIGRDDLVDAIVNRVSKDGKITEYVGGTKKYKYHKPSRTRILEIAKTDTQLYGSEGKWHEDWNDDDWVIANGIIDELFPELKEGKK